MELYTTLYASRANRPEVWKKLKGTTRTGIYRVTGKEMILTNDSQTLTMTYYGSAPTRRFITITTVAAAMENQM